MRLAFACVAVLLIAAGQVSAGVVVAPQEFESTEAPVYNFLFQSGEYTLQYATSASSFSTLAPGSQITGLGFRLDSRMSPPGTLSIDRFDIQLSRIDSLSLSDTFADNIGGDVVAARSGPLELSLDSSFAGGNPNPFFNIGFDHPFNYTGGGILVTIQSENSMEASSYLVDAVTDVENFPDALYGLDFTSQTSMDVPVPVTRFTVHSSSHLPEPASLVIFGVAGLALIGMGRRKPRQRDSSGINRETGLAGCC